MTSLRRVPLLLLLLALVPLLLVAPARGADRVDPPLGVSSADLAASLVCSPIADHAALRDPVLLVPGTTLDAATNFDWNYEPALNQAAIPWCAVTVPNHGMTDIQVAAAYIVHAIRVTHARTGRPVHVVGYSQGGMSPRWALKFWPGTRALVDEVIAIDPSNHGTYSAVPLCAGPCAPSFRQQQTGSHFLETLNSGAETYAGVDYTNVYTLTDEVVTPNLGPAASSSLHTGSGDIANIAAQTVCPTDVADHLTMGTTDPVAWAVVLDAYSHPGPAVAHRVNRGACLAAYMPGVSAGRLAANEVRFLGQVANSAATAPRTSSEPPLAPYAS